MRNYKNIGGHATKMRRDVSTSVRMDSRIREYIMQQPGRSFADKLENLVLDHVLILGSYEDFLGK